MRVFISTELEGVAGINHPEMVYRSNDVFKTSAALTVAEANAAIEGALAAGATYILVNDSHMKMYNIPPQDLHPAAVLLTGNKAWSMLAGTGPGTIPGPLADQGPFDAAFFIGYHSRAGHPYGGITHTYSPKPTQVTINDRPVGESAINATVLGHFGTPVALVTGDDALREEITEWMPDAEYVTVKYGTGGTSSASVHPERARELIRAGAEKALRRVASGEISPCRVQGDLTYETEFRNANDADYAAFIPGAERVGERRVRFTADNPLTAYRGFVAGLFMAAQTDSY